MKRGMAKKTQTIPQILLGDRLGELAGRVDIDDSDAKLIIIVVGAGGIRLAMSNTISRAEAVGSLYLALDQVSNEWDNVNGTWQQRS